MLIQLAQRRSNARVAAITCAAVVLVMAVSACGDRASGQATAVDPQVAAIERNFGGGGWDCFRRMDQTITCTQPNGDSFAMPYEIRFVDGKVFFQRNGRILRASQFLALAEGSVAAQYQAARDRHPKKVPWPVTIKCKVVDPSLPYRIGCAVTKRGMVTEREPVIVDLHGEVYAPSGPDGH
jgi:hypothetical protein